MPSKKKLFEIVNNGGPQVVEVGGRKFKFGKQGMFQTPDAAIAKDIQQTSGQDGTRKCTVIDVPNNNERGIQVFSLPRGDWKERIDWSIDGRNKE